MRRRKLLTVGGAIFLGSLAGCGGGGDEGEPESTPTPDAETETQEETATPEEPEEGGVTFAVDPSSSEIDIGEPYTVTVTAKAGDESVEAVTGIIFKRGDQQSWSGPISDTGKRWQLKAGESQTANFDLEPGSVEEYTLALADSENKEVIEEWELTVNRPTAAFGKTISYYDGLEMTVDVEVHEWLEFELSWDGGDKTGTYAVRPREGQWAKVWVKGKNPEENDQDVTAPAGEDFNGLAGGQQFNRIKRNGVTVGADTDYKIDDSTREAGGADMETMDEYWLPPETGITRGTLIPGAVHEGMVLFEASGTDWSVEDIKIMLNRNDIRATWESTP